MVSKKLHIAPKYNAYDSASTILRLYGPEHEEAKSDYNKIIETVNKTDNLDLLVEVNLGLEVLIKNPKFPHSSMIGVKKWMNKSEVEAQQLRLSAIANMTRALKANPNVEELITYAKKNNFILHDVEILAGKRSFDVLEQTLKWKAHLDKIYVKVTNKAQEKGDTSSEKHEIKYAGLLRKANEIAEHFQLGRPWSKEYTDLISLMYNKKTVEELTAPIKGEVIADYES
jgi:hypothetical protein